MTQRRLRLPSPDPEVDAALAAVLTENGVVADFPADVLAEAERIAAAVEQPDLPRTDLTGFPFVTIDPPGSLDLDQAVLITGGGGAPVVVRYAIADVPSVVPTGGPLDAETRRRGQTYYLPDARVPLHPPLLSEDAASLLPDVVRRAVVWTFELDPTGEPRTVRVERALVRSVARLDYRGVQDDADAGRLHPSIALLPEVGSLRAALEAARGGASLTLPEEEIERSEDGYRVRRVAPLPVEGWNAQISLMTGMAAARIMLDARIGVLRTMPEADAEAIASFRARAGALGHPWADGLGYGAYLRTLDTDDPAQLAIMFAAASLFRGAGYTAFDGELPENIVQSALGAPYAHTTAPLRRLVDRFVLSVCLAVAAGESVPEEVRAALPTLPGIMAASDRLAGVLDRAATAVIEAAVLRDRVGRTLEGVVVSASSSRSSVQLLEPEVTIDVPVRLEPGTRAVVVLESVDVRAGSAVFRVADPEVRAPR